MIRVLIIDDQPLLTDGFGRIVDAQPGMKVVGAAHDGASGVKLCRELKPDVVLMDISMPVMNGVAATRRIRDILPETKILILTTYADDVHVFQGMKAGATGYLLKDCTPDDLFFAITSVHDGDTIVAPGIARETLLTFEEAREAPEAPSLSEREIEVITALARGRGNKQIARDLGISDKTVRNHVSSIYKKLHVYDRLGAVLYAIKEGLVDVDSLEGP